MNYDMVWQIVRYFLLIAGGALVSRGLLSDEQLTTIVTAIGTLAVAGWGIYIKWGSSAVPASTAARVDVPTLSPVTGQKIPGSASDK